MYDRGSQASSASPLAGEPSWTKSSSVVSLGRNVTVSWTKFRAAMRIASAKAVEAEGATGEHLVLRLGGQPSEPLAEHLRRAREEAVRVRIVGGPHDLVRPDVVGQHRDAALDRPNEIQQLRWNSSLGLVFGADSLKPWSSKCRSMRSSHGAIQPPPDSRNAMRKRGWRSTTPPQITLSATSIISIVCETMCRAARSSSKRSTPTVGIALVDPS